jgi:hypothetical protein
MELKNRNIHNFLYNRITKEKIPGWIKCPVETKYFKILNDNMIKNSQKRIENIKIRITNDINKNNFTKKYQINSRDEYNILVDFYKTLNIDKYELLWCNDMNLERNKLDKIIEGDYDCCRDCDRPMVFVNKKIPVRYCYFYKSFAFKQ